MPMRTPLVRLVAALLVLAAGVARADDFVNFESGQVRPLALSPDGTRLFAVDTPDARLEIFAVDAAGPHHTGSVPVGLEPVAVAARNDGEVWVVNHLSDSVSVVDVASDPPRVVRTLLTCDEPRDIVFAGPDRGRAFVTTARRGQNCPVAAALTTPGVGRALVQVWDAAALESDTTLAGTPLAAVELFGDTPRALATSPDGNTVYAAVFQSGNETTTVGEGTVCDGGAGASPCGAFLERPGGLPAPNVNVEGIPGPEVGLIVKHDDASGAWLDSVGRDWSGTIKFELPDLDVFAIDAAAAVPAETASFAHVGTVLFDMVANPVSGRVYVSNTEARNDVRFEGFGLTFGTSTVQGHLHEARITVLDGASVLPRHLNKHIDYSQRPAPPGVKERSLATPTAMAVTHDGKTLYVAAFGSGSVGVFSTAELEQDTFVPDAASHIAVSGGGPSGLVLDEARGRLYVLTRFDDAISVVDLATRAETAHVGLFDPEPAVVRDGRPFLYDAQRTSSNGEASCSSCHVFGDFDSLAWDLGDPDGVVAPNPIPFRIQPLGIPNDFHPLKGPMTTQSLRGLANAGAMHWRGDRNGGDQGDPFSDLLAFEKFNVAFPGLVGNDQELSDADMQKFAEFALTITYPPNPIRRLNGTLTNQQQLGHDLFFGRVTDVLFNCDGCHHLDPALGFFGTDGFSTFEGETQMFKVAHLRNAYQKVGMFGRPQDAPQGPQVRGFGFLHDGSIDTVFHFLGSSVFSLTNAEQRRLEQFVLAFDSNLAPIVGQQVTLTDANAAAVGTRLNLLMARAALGECDVVVHGTIDGEARAGRRLGDGAFQLDRDGDVRSDADLRALAATPGQPLTYTCAPPGTGVRQGGDRDGDGVLDRDELDQGSDPADAREVPATPIAASTLMLRDRASTQRKLTFVSRARGAATSGVVVPAAGSPADPTLGGGVVVVHSTRPGSTTVRLALPASGWSRGGSDARPRYRYDDRRHLHGPITAVSITDGRLKVKGVGYALYPLAGAPQGSMVVRVETGERFGFCAVAPARSPSSTHDTPVRFVGAATAAPARCPPLP
jgi:DNA-binding beta-propeller fold protein YncE